jgi:hypothetical protein
VVLLAQAITSGFLFSDFFSILPNALFSCGVYESIKPLFMRRFQGVFLLLVASLFMVQCQRELSHIGQPDPGVILPQPVTATLQGNIVNEMGQPEAGVQIRIGNKSATTNASGYFRIADASLDKISAVVTAEKAGYFKAYRTFSATSGTNQIAIKLIKKEVAGTVNGAAGGDATLSNGAKVNLKAGGVINAATGALYSGTVNVYASYIDPSSADIAETVPGSFMAVNKNNQRVTLASFGMIAVELEGASGEKLQIKSGSTATLTMPIPSVTQSSAPATIALWYVDEQTGLWKEQGSAEKQGSNYVGDVTHFSYWNCDIGMPSVAVQFMLKNAAGEPVRSAYVQIKLQKPVGNGFAHGYTDTLGQGGGLVPANEALVMEVRDRCNNVVYSQNIGPFNKPTDLGVITLPNATSGSVKITGKVLNCSGGAVTNGYATITIGNWVFNVLTNSIGDFSLSTIICSGATNYSIVATDLGTMQQSNPVSGTVATPQTNAGNISACGISAAQFITYTIDGTTVNYVVPGDSLTAWTSPGQSTNSWQTSVSGSRWASQSFSYIDFRFTSPTQAPGTYAIESIATNTFPRNTSPVNSFNVNVTSFPATAGGFYEGNFNGQFRDSANAVHNINATFRVRRNF